MTIYRKYSKVVVAFVLCFALVLMPFSFSANALSSDRDFTSGSYNRFGALIAAALSALNITIQSVAMPINDLYNYVADPFDLVYSFQEDELASFMNRSVIKITPDKINIDGVDYSDVWISYDASNKFRTDGLDFATAYSIASHTSGTFASGVGTIEGIPSYLVDGIVRTQDIYFPSFGTYTVGDSSFLLRDSGNNRTEIHVYTSKGYDAFANYMPGTPPWTCYYTYQYFYTPNGRINVGGHITEVSEPFDFDFVAGDIPADPLSYDDGLRLRIPSSEINDFISDYPEFIQSTGYEIDETLDPDINAKLDDLFDIIAAILPVIMEEDNFITYEAMDTPTPPTYTNIADTNYSILNNTLQNIEDWLDDIYTGIQEIPSAIGGLIDGFLNDIEIGPIKVFDKALDLIQSLFAPVFLLIRNGLSIWSYVVTWVNTLSAPLTFMVAVLPLAVWLPVYALVAGTICLAIFRRFGK